MPQHLELDDVLAWGLGAADLLHLALGGLFAWWLYLWLPAPFAVRVPLAALMAITAAILGIGKLGDQPVRKWALVLVDYLGRPRRRLYGDAG